MKLESSLLQDSIFSAVDLYRFEIRISIFAPFFCSLFQLQLQSLANYFNIDLHQLTSSSTTTDGGLQLRDILLAFTSNLDIVVFIVARIAGMIWFH